MKVEVFPTISTLARAAAKRLAAVLRRRTRSVLLLPVGKTVVPIYRELARLHAAGRAPFARTTTFNLDELSVSPEDPRSFRSFMERHLFSKVDLAPRRIRFLHGDASDPERECARYERALAREGPPDVALLGIGVNGHVAYLEPARSLPPRTLLVRLSASTRRGLAADGVRPVPREALTVGIETILSSREIVLIAVGRRKAAAVAAALEGPVTPRLPASFLSLHPRLEVLLDRAAASGLRL
ncbi:MAG TPA: glucosamine-6-phosphate deaminase [Thermoanaerobaculia bacterium]|nr:glucosamine-6-phosphate deaminase [Thermoanaerobaculia bacterium]